MKKPNEFPTGQGFILKQHKTSKAANPEMWEAGTGDFKGIFVC